MTNHAENFPHSHAHLPASSASPTPPQQISADQLTAQVQAQPQSQPQAQAQAASTMDLRVRLLNGAVQPVRVPRGITIHKLRAELQTRGLIPPNLPARDVRLIHVPFSAAPPAAGRSGEAAGASAEERRTSGKEVAEASGYLGGVEGSRPKVLSSKLLTVGECGVDSGGDPTFTFRTVTLESSHPPPFLLPRAPFVFSPLPSLRPPSPSLSPPSPSLSPPSPSLSPPSPSLSPPSPSPPLPPPFPPLPPPFAPLPPPFTPLPPPFPPPSPRYADTLVITRIRAPTPCQLAAPDSSAKTAAAAADAIPTRESIDRAIEAECLQRQQRVRVVADPVLVDRLAEMGFSRLMARHALHLHRGAAGGAAGGATGGAAGAGGEGAGVASGDSEALLAVGSGEAAEMDPPSSSAAVAASGGMMGSGVSGEAGVAAPAGAAGAGAAAAGEAAGGDVPMAVAAAAAAAEAAAVQGGVRAGTGEAPASALGGTQAPLQGDLPAELREAWAQIAGMHDERSVRAWNRMMALQTIMGASSSTSLPLHEARDPFGGDVEGGEGGEEEAMDVEGAALWAMANEMLRHGLTNPRVRQGEFMFDRVHANWGREERG
ncbi:unnamed protein product [Closterium sp. Naga37s-1]|nr:unnamed protein product [Closterium sp. Naga37s-1]